MDEPKPVDLGVLRRVVVAYTGRLDASLAIRELSRSGIDVITVTVDVGQGDDLADIRERALSLGALRAHVIDARDEFVRRFVVPSLQASALQDGVYPLSAHMTRALVAGRLVSIARMESASTILHGSTRERSRLELPIRALDSSIDVATAQDFIPDALSAASTNWAKDLGINIGGDSWSKRVDVNLWGRSIELGPLPSAGGRLPEEMFALTRPVSEAPDDPAFVEIEFAGGTPIRLNGIDMPLVEIIESLETIAGSHGVGRLERTAAVADGVCVEVHEAPTAVVLHAAHDALERVVIDHERAERKALVSRKYAEVVASGGWFGAARAEMDTFVATLQPAVTGVVRAKLYKGECTVVSGQSTTQDPVIADGQRRRATVG
jgi:argininosuccinate synthase